MWKSEIASRARVGERRDGGRSERSDARHASRKAPRLTRRTREVQAAGRVVRLSVYFGVRLRDYGISIPTIAELKVADDIGIEV